MAYVDMQSNLVLMTDSTHGQSLLGLLEPTLDASD
jgi:hypothetical protein